jgi:hypothetical protein
MYVPTEPLPVVADIGYVYVDPVTLVRQSLVSPETNVSVSPVKLGTKPLSTPQSPISHIVNPEVMDPVNPVVQPLNDSVSQAVKEHTPEYGGEKDVVLLKSKYVSPLIILLVYNVWNSQSASSDDRVKSQYPSFESSALMFLKK